MSLRLGLGAVMSLGAVLLATSVASAECTKDVDCKGDRVCQDGACVDPAPATSTPPLDAPGGSAQPAATPAAATPAPTAATPTPAAAPALSDAPTTPPKGKRHSKAMMVTGTVLLGAAPLAVIVAVFGKIKKDGCESGGGHLTIDDGPTYQPHQADCSRFNPSIYGGLFASAALLGAGIPLVIIGGKREPVAAARIAPWAGPHGAGVDIQLDL